MFSTPSLAPLLSLFVLPLPCPRREKSKVAHRSCRRHRVGKLSLPTPYEYLLSSAVRPSLSPSENANPIFDGPDIVWLRYLLPGSEEATANEWFASAQLHRALVRAPTGEHLSA